MDETTAMAGAVSQEASAFTSAVSRDSAPGIDVAPVPVEPESQISVTPPAESFRDAQGQPMPDPSATMGTGAVRSEIARMPSMREQELAGMTEWTRRNMALTETIRACLETGVASEQASCLSQSTGIPLPEVSRNLEQLRQATEAFDASSAFDSDDFRRRYPYEARLILERPEMVDVAIRKAGFFDVLANPGAILRAIGKAKAMKANEVGGKARNIPVGQLDFDTVMDLADQEMKAKGEDVFSLAFQTVPKTAAKDGDTLSRAWKVGRLQDEDSDLGQQAAAAIMSGRVDEYEYIRYLHMKNNAEQEKLRKPVDGLSAEGVLQNALTSVPGSAGVMADGAAGAAIGSAFGAFLSPAGAAAGAKVGGAIGSTVATFSSSRQQQLGGNVWDYVDLRTDDGRQVDPRYAVLAARQGAIFGAAIETAENALDLLTLGGAGVEGRVASGMVRKNALDSVMAGAARNAASEAAEEATQTMGSAWFAQRERIYAADGEDQSFDYRKMWNDVADSMLAAGVMGGAFGAGMGAVPAMSRAIRSPGFLKFARRNAAEQTALSDAAKRQVLADQMAEMDPVTRSVIAPEATRQAASDDGSPLHTVEVSPDRIVQFFMDDGLNAEEQLSRAMGDGFAAAVMNGLESGTEVSFSLTRFSQDFAALKNTKGQTLAQYVAPDAHAPGIPSRSDVEAAHADDGAFSQAIKAAVDGGLTEQQRGTLLKQTAADAGIVGVEFVDEARELADQATARLYDEAVSSGISEDIAEAGVSAAVQSALAMTLKTGTMDFIGALATETSISGASVAYIGELAEANGVAPAKVEAPVEETRAEAQVVTQEAPVTAQESVSQEPVSQETPAQEEAPAQEVGVSEMETATPQESAPEAQAAPAQEETQDPVAKAREAAEWMDSSAHLLVVGGYGIGTAMSATEDAFRVHMSRIDALKQSLSGLDHAMRNRAEVQRIGSLLDSFRKLLEDGKYPIAGNYYQNSIRPRLDLLLAGPGTVGAEINALQDDATRAYDEDSWDGKNWPSPAMKAVMKRGYAMARRLRGQAKTKTGVVEQDLYELSKAVTALELMAKKNINYYDAILKVDYSLRDSDLADEMSWDRSDSRIAADDTKLVRKVLKHADKDAKEVTLQDVAEATGKAMQEQNAPATGAHRFARLSDGDLKKLEKRAERLALEIDDAIMSGWDSPKLAKRLYDLKARARAEFDHVADRAEFLSVTGGLETVRLRIMQEKGHDAKSFYLATVKPKLDLLVAKTGTPGAETNALQDAAMDAWTEAQASGGEWPTPAMKAVIHHGYELVRGMKEQAGTKEKAVGQDLYDMAKAVVSMEVMAQKNIPYRQAMEETEEHLRTYEERYRPRHVDAIMRKDQRFVRGVLSAATEVTLQDVTESTEKAVQEQNAPVTASDLVDEDGREVLFSGTRGATVFPGSGDAPAYRRKKKKPDSAKKQERKETTTTVPPEALKEYYGILLSPDATASTIVHESAHIMLDVMRRVAHEKSRRTTPAFVAGVNAVEQFLGLEADAVPTREQQEKFAAQMELYLAEGESEAGEGVAPVLSWTREQFRASVQKLENEGAVLSDEASAFFSSIFDADDVVQEAEGLAVSEMMSSTLAMADPSEVDALMKRMLQGVDSVKRDAVVAQLHKDLAKERSLAHDLKNLTMADQEMMDLEKARVLKEMSYDERALYTGARLRKAMLDGVDEFGNAVGEWRLDRNEARQAFGGRIPRRLALMTVEQGGLRYWDVLQMFPGMADAFASAREMFDAVSAAPNSLDDEVAKRARQAVRDRCREKVAKLERRVRELTFSPEMANRIFDDLLKLGTSPHLRKDLEEASAAYVVSRSYAKVHKSWGPWTTAMKRAQREVIKALKPSKDGVHGMDRGRAAYWQQSVAYAYGVLDAIRQADQAYRRAVKSLRSWADDDTAKAVGRASLDLQGVWLDAMEAFGFRRPPEDESQIAQRPRDRDAAMSALAAARGNAGLGVPFIGETAAGYDRFMELVKSGASFVDLTVGDQAFALQFLHEIHAAAMGQVIEVEGLGRMDAKEFAEKAAGMLPGRDRPAYMDSALKGIRRRLDDGVLKFIGARLDALALLDRMGDVGTAIFDELNRGEGMKTDMTESIKAKLEDIFSRSSPALQRIREQVDGAPGELPEGVVGGLTRQNMLVMALNTGNEGNFSRLLDGFGGEEKGWTPESVMAWLDARMEKSDWDFVQQVWDLMDRELYPRVAQTYLEVEALPMRKVRAVSVETRHGTYRGGYYPIHYDPDSSVGQRQEVSAADTVNAWNAATAQGFTKNRADRPQMPRLSLEWASLFPAISQQIQYATHEKAARNVSRLLNRREFSDAVTRKFGRDYMKLARDMVKTYASGPENTVSLGSMFNWVSNMVTQSILGWSFPAAIGDLARPFMAAGMSEVSGMAALRAAMNPRESVELARNLSAEFRTLTSRTTARFLSQDFVEADAGVTAFGKDAVSDPTAAYDAASAAFRRYRRRIETLNFYLMEKVTQFTAATIWSAALHDAMDAGLQGTEAVKRADRAIQKLMPNTTEWRKSEVQRSAWYRIATVFAGEGLKTLSIMAHTHPEKLLEDAKGGDLQKLARRVAAVSSVLMLYPLLSALIMGRGRDEDEGWAFWGLRTSLQGVAGFDPIFGAGIWAGIEVALSGRNQVATGPLAIHYGRLSRDMNALFEVKGPSTPAEKAFAIVDAIGPTASLPTNEIQKVAKPLVGVNGVDDDEDVLDLIESVLYGRSSRRGWNAFRLLETDAKKARTEARRKADRRDRGRRNANARRNRRQ